MGPSWASPRDPRAREVGRAWCRCTRRIAGLGMPDASTGVSHSACTSAAGLARRAPNARLPPGCTMRLVRPTPPTLHLPFVAWMHRRCFFDAVRDARPIPHVGTCVVGPCHAAPRVLGFVASIVRRNRRIGRSGQGGTGAWEDWLPWPWCRSTSPGWTDRNRSVSIQLAKGGWMT